MMRVGCAAGFSGDRTDAAGPVVDTLVARCLAKSADDRFQTMQELVAAIDRITAPIATALHFATASEPVVAPRRPRAWLPIALAIAVAATAVALARLL